MGINLSCENKQNILIEKSKFGTWMTLKSRREPRTQNPEPRTQNPNYLRQLTMANGLWNLGAG